MDEIYLRLLTRNAEEWRNKLNEQKEGFRYSSIVAVIRDNRDLFINILLEEIETAITTSNEYNRLGAYYADIRQAIEKSKHSPMLFSVNEDNLELQFNLENVLGTQEDFREGVDAARAQLAKTTGSTLTRKEKAQYWQYSIWPDDTKYDFTINLRMRAWGSLAPYWHWLDVGNEGKMNAFPQSPATNFRRKAQDRCTELMISAYNKLQNIAGNAVERALMKFLDDPEGYQPFDVLDQFTMGSENYYIYLTKTGRIGVALPSTYAGEVI